MAAAVVTVVIEDILRSLADWTKLGQQWGITRELKETHSLLSSIQGVLLQVENKYGQRFEIQEWVRVLKNAAFDVEDLLEELSVENALWQRKRKVHRIFRAVDRFMFRRRMHVELRGVVRRLHDAIVPNRISFVSNIPDEIGKDHEEEVGAVPFIGRDDEKRRLMKLFYESHLVIVVQGSGGIGKTALVRELLEWEVKRRFNIVWVDASPPNASNRVARDIIANLTKYDAPEEEKVVEEQLLMRLGKLLDERNRYLFILDNLSSTDSERQRQRLLRFCSFVEGASPSSKIIVTTRDSRPIYHGGPVVRLGDLPREDSLDLLLETALEGRAREGIDPATLKFAEEVTAQCNGNPLLLRSVGKYLSLQPDGSHQWSVLSEQVNKYVFQASLLDGGYPYVHLGPKVKRYNHLPPRIKQCFGLCSLFPRGHLIDRQSLAELWIALGYIKSSNEDNRPLEVIAEHYFDSLVRNNLLVDKEFINSVQVRSAVLDRDQASLARAVAGRECDPRMWSYDSRERAMEALHASILDFENFDRYDDLLPRLRTVLHFLDDTSGCETMWNHIIPNLKRARVLDLHRLNAKTVHEGVWKLKLLRYLDLSDNRKIETLPPAIVGLPNLQTLKLSGCYALKELPQDMRKMVALRHLYIDCCRKLSFLPKGLGDLKLLNVLTDFIFPPDDLPSVDFANFSDLSKMNHLRGSLRITNLGYSETTKPYSEATSERFMIQRGLLHEKSSLESLELGFMNRLTDSWLLENLLPHPNLKRLRILNYGDIIFPGWMARPMTFLPNLVEITLIGCRYLNDNYFPQLCQLPHLKSLTIQGLPNLIRIESTSGLSSPDVHNNGHHSFSMLSSLCIRDCLNLQCLPLIPHLEKLTLVDVSEQLFRHPIRVDSLKALRLENIGLLNHLPEEWLPGLTCLEELHIRNCPKLNHLSAINCWRLRKMTLTNVSEELFSKPSHLTVLRTLRLENIEFLHHLTGDWLKELTNLKELHIGSCPALVSVSRGMMHLKNLVSLSIWNCKELDLSKDEDGNIMMKPHGLCSLGFLTIYKATKMEYLPEWLSSVYTLRFLCIRSCPNLVALPQWVLRSLKQLELIHCPRLTSLPSQMYKLTIDHPRKLCIIGCPLLQTEGIEHSRSL